MHDIFIKMLEFIKETGKTDSWILKNLEIKPFYFYLSTFVGHNSSFKEYRKEMLLNALYRYVLLPSPSSVPKERIAICSSQVLWVPHSPHIYSIKEFEKHAPSLWYSFTLQWTETIRNPPQPNIKYSCSFIRSERKHTV